MADSVERLHVIFIGDVQGVGFRYTAKRAAAAYPEITGMVRNLPDGPVELLAEGPSSDVNGLIADICTSMGHHIYDMHKEVSTGNRMYRAFVIEF